MPALSTRTLVRPNMALGEIMSFAYDTFCSNKVRFALTALGMVIGTASLILVVTIGMTGRQYALRQIQSIGTNEIWAEYQGGTERIGNSDPDLLTMGDLEAIRRDVPGIVAASPVLQLNDRVAVGNGKERDLVILGVSPEYVNVRDLVVPAGRFFDQEDSLAHNKVAVIIDKMAVQLYGSSQAAVGKVLKLNGLPFTVIGTFKERVETFGQTEIVDNTILIPYSVSLYFTQTPQIKMLYFSMADSSMVPAATAEIKRVIQPRHRSESVYNVDNLTAVLAMMNRIATGLTWVLFLVSMVTLVVSGIGIMNIMLVTVRERTREIGVRKAIGAQRKEIMAQFLVEAFLISGGGAVIGILLGLAIPVAVQQLLPGNLRVPISNVSVIVAFLVSSLTGLFFGWLPANQAAKLDPVESLRYE